MNVVSRGRGLGFVNRLPAVSSCIIFRAAPQAGLMFSSACCTGCCRLCLVPPMDRLLVYGGLSTFTLVTLPVKHLWNRMSGLGGWLSQSSLRLMKCFLNPCGPLEEVSLVWLDPSLASPPSDVFREMVLQRQHDEEFLHATGARTHLAL